MFVVDIARYVAIVNVSGVHKTISSIQWWGGDLRSWVSIFPGSQGATKTLRASQPDSPDVSLFIQVLSFWTWLLTINQYINQWGFMMYHDLPWFTMIDHDSPWFTMICHDLPWLPMVYHGLRMTRINVPAAWNKETPRPSRRRRWDTRLRATSSPSRWRRCWSSGWGRGTWLDMVPELRVIQTWRAQKIPHFYRILMK